MWMVHLVITWQSFKFLTRKLQSGSLYIDTSDDDNKKQFLIALAHFDFVKWAKK